MSGQTQHPLELTCWSGSGQLPGALLDRGASLVLQGQRSPTWSPAPASLGGGWGERGSGQTELQLEGGHWGLWGRQAAPRPEPQGVVGGSG